MSQNWLVAYFEPNKYIAVRSPNGETLSTLRYDCGIVVVVIGVCHTLDYKTFSTLGYDGFLSWSADGKRLAIATECNIHIWTPGESLIALLDGNTCGLFMHPDWSPDGDFIAYASQELLRIAPSGQVYLSDVFLHSLDGTVHRPLTTDLGGGSSPAWSPDGRWIAFESNGEIVIYALDTDEVINLTQGLGGGNPAWSPDGQFIAYTRRHGENVDLYMMQSDGSGSRKVAQLGEDYPYLLVWLPDGQHLLYNDSLIDLETGTRTLLRLGLGTRYMAWFAGSGRATVLPVPTPHCASGWSRLDMGDYAVVTGGSSDPPKTIYGNPSTSSPVKALISPGQVVRVWQGPICADGLVLWEVQSEVLDGPEDVGWIAEGDGSAYYLEPYQAQP